MDYKKKYLKYKMKYLEAKKLYGGMDAKTLTEKEKQKKALSERVEKIFEDLPKKLVKFWKETAIRDGDWNTSKKLITLIEGYSKEGYIYDVANHKENAIYNDIGRGDKYYHEDMIDKIVKVGADKELDEILTFWENNIKTDEIEGATKLPLPITDTNLAYWAEIKEKQEKKELNEKWEKMKKNDQTKYLATMLPEDREELLAKIEMSNEERKALLAETEMWLQEQKNQEDENEKNGNK